MPDRPFYGLCDNQINKMKIGSKITVAALVAVMLATTVCLVRQARQIERQEIERIRSEMSTALADAESVRQSISTLHRDGAFDLDKLVAEARTASDMRDTALYNTIPVVAAWNAIQDFADSKNYEFRISKHEARNPKNLPTPDEEAVLARLHEDTTRDYFEIDEVNQQIVFAVPVILSGDCMTCHGDPANSPTGDGKDMLGFTMENWEAGDMRGAFILKADLAPVKAAARAEIVSTIAWIIPLVAGVGLGFYFFNRRYIVRPLKHTVDEFSEASNQTAAASTQLAEASQTMAECASEQASSLEETSASLVEMASVTQRNAENARQASALAHDTRQSTEAGLEHMRTMSTAMTQIKSASGNIGRIVKSIDEIAFQTNILALNAAVEAARAGEAGAGFSVVAQEVRDLAQRSAKAAKETSAIVEESIRSTEEGVIITTRVEASLQEITERIRRMDSLIGEIAAASTEQSSGIGQINEAVIQMDHITQSNAASAEEGAAASEELGGQVLALKKGVDELRALFEDVRTANDASPSSKRPQSKRVQPKAASAVRTTASSVSAGPGSRRVSPQPTGGGDFRDF